MKTLKIIALFFSIAILTHVLILWAYDWKELYTFLVLIADVVSGVVSVSVYIAVEERVNEIEIPHSETKQQELKARIIKCRNYMVQTWPDFFTSN